MSSGNSVLLVLLSCLRVPSRLQLFFIQYLYVVLPFYSCRPRWDHIFDNERVILQDFKISTFKDNVYGKKGMIYSRPLKWNIWPNFPRYSLVSVFDNITNGVKKSRLGTTMIRTKRKGKCHYLHKKIDYLNSPFLTLPTLWLVGPLTPFFLSIIRNDESR